MGPNVPWSRRQVFWTIFLSIFVPGMLYLAYVAATIEEIDRWPFVVRSAITGFAIAYAAGHFTSRSIRED